MSTTTIEKSTFPVTGMSCAGCASSVENILNKMEGVNKAEVNFASNSVLVSYDTEAVNKEELKSNLQGAGYDIIISSDNAEEEQEELHDKDYKEIKKRTLWAGILTLPVFVLGMFFMDWKPGHYISLAFAIPILFVFGRNFFINSWKQAKHGKV